MRGAAGVGAASAALVVSLLGAAPPAHAGPAGPSGVSATPVVGQAVPAVAAAAQVPTAVAMRSGVRQVRLVWGPPVSGPATVSFQSQVRTWSSRTASWSAWRTATHGPSVRSRLVVVKDGIRVQGRVRAIASSGRGPWSGLVAAKAGTPSAPSGVTVSASGVQKATVTWRPARANSAPVLAYEVRRRSLVGSSWTPWTTTRVGASARSWTGTRVPVGTMQVTLRAINRLGTGPVSAVRQAVIPGPAVKLVVTVPPAATTLGARDVIVEARDAANNRATSYRGTVRFTSSYSGWGLAAGAFPAETDGLEFVVDDQVPGDYTFTAADAGRRVFVGGWVQTQSLVWGLTATDAARPSVSGRTRIDLPSEITVKNGVVQARVQWGAPLTLTQVLKGSERDPRLHGVTLDFYDEGLPGATTLPGTGGLARFVLPAEDWSIWYPVGDGTIGYGWRYTGDGTTGCSEVTIMVAKITASCAAGSLTGPLQGALRMWLQMGNEVDGPATFCPGFSGAQLVRNVAGDIRTRTATDALEAGWGSCLSAGDDLVYVTDPMAVQIDPQPEFATVWGQYQDEWQVDVLANDVSTTPAALAWDRVPADCVADEQFLGGFECGFLAPNPTEFWGFIYPPEWGLDPKKVFFTSQPDCGLFRDPLWVPESGIFDGVSGNSCTVPDELTARYTVSDGLHTAYGRIVLRYETPDRPDLSAYDLSSRDALMQGPDGLVVKDPATGETFTTLAPGEDIPVVNVRSEGQTLVVSADLLIFCNDCPGGVAVASVKAIEPTLAKNTDPTTGELVGGEPLRIEVPLSLVLLPNFTLPTGFKPVITTNANPPQCNFQNQTGCPPPPRSVAHTPTLLEVVNVETRRSACESVGGVLSFNTALVWLCEGVTASVVEAERKLSPFCFPRTETYNRTQYVGTMTRKGADWECILEKRQL